MLEHKISVHNIMNIEIILNNNLLKIKVSHKKNVWDGGWGVYGGKKTTHYWIAFGSRKNFIFFVCIDMQQYAFNKYQLKELIKVCHIC